MKTMMIAVNTFREAVRNKVLYTLLFFALLFAGLSVSLSTIIIGEYTRIIIDMGLANLEIFGTMIAIFVGINLVYKELEQRTIYTIITRPIERHHFIIGKYMGLLATLALQILIMAAIFFFIISLFGAADRIGDLSIAIWLIFMKLALITAVAVFFSSLSSPILSGLFTLAFYLIGNASSFLDLLITDFTSPAVATIIRMLAWFLPNFDYMNINALVVYDKPIDPCMVIGATAYSALYLFIVLIGAILIFDRKDMK